MTHVSLVGDMTSINAEAYWRLQLDYGFAGYPSVFYDGGANVGVGGTSDESFYRTRIESSGMRAVPNLDLLIRMDYVSGTTYDISVKIGNGITANFDPVAPTSFSGPLHVTPNTSAEFRTASTDPDSDQLYYQFDWDDGTLGDWVGPYNSGDSCTANYAWSQENYYDVKVRTKDVWGYTTDWSPVTAVGVSCCVGFRGNIDNSPDDQIDIGDLISLVSFMFESGDAPPCMHEADVNGSLGGNPIDIGDLIHLVAYMFQSGPEPAACP